MGGTNNFEGCIGHGPWGGFQGKEWVYKPEKFIRKIIVEHGGVVDSIKFQTYYCESETQSSFFGGPGGNRTDTISFDNTDEYLVSISGTFGNFDESVVVTSISFKTNETSYGPYGTHNGKAFTYDGKGGMIVGFHGLVNKYLTAIGVYVIPELFAYGYQIMPELCSSMSTMAMSRDVGPWGAGGGKPWDDGVFSSIKQIHVHEGELNVIYALQFEYLKSDGKSVWSQIHGGTDGVRDIRVGNLDVNDEFLMGISGFYGPVKGYNGLEAIASISIHTNKRIYGPNGHERCAGYNSYSSTVSPGKVIGFHGRDNGFLSKIGVHMEYF